jgi:hypothetical protein
VGAVSRRKKRFKGAGGSADREFSRRRQQNIRDDWRTWMTVTFGAVGFAVWSFLASGFSGRALAWMSGVLVGALLVVWALGGHVSAFRWWLGAEGERATAKEIERLGSGWHCEHDLEHEHGNWDHVLVGPPGVFLLDSKLLHTTAAAGRDALRSGRIVYSGGSFRAVRAVSRTRSNANLAGGPRGYRRSWSSGVTFRRRDTRKRTSSMSGAKSSTPGWKAYRRN